jgi:agmatine deiminase
MGSVNDAPSRFHMPAESAPHERTFMQWPSSSALYERGELEAIQNAIVRIANIIAEHEPVVMLSKRMEREGNKAKLATAIELWDIPTDDLWCRDSGPTFVVNEAGELAVAHLRFNGWGNKQAHRNDAQIAAGVAKRLGVPLRETGLIGEQGGIEHDGAGLILAHISSWQGGARNELPLQTIRERLCAALGSSRVIWAPGLVNEDITDFHIDALARFTAPGQVVIQIEDDADPRDVWSIAASETLKMLEAERDLGAAPLEIVKFAGPTHVRSSEPSFVGSYINYYVCNGAVIAPQFGDAAADCRARNTLAALYPDRVVRMLDIDPIAEVGGGIHCATQQQPSRWPGAQRIVHRP